MIGQEIKQVRCTTCDAEHEYKQARVPPQRRKKDAPATLYDDVLAGMPRKVPPVAARPLDAAPDADAGGEEADAPDVAAPAAETAPLVAAAAPDAAEGPVHRPLIRATLPRPEGQPAVRPIPEFTARTAATARPGRFRPPRRNGAHAQAGANGFGFRERRGGNSVAAGGQAPHGNRARPAQGGHGPHRRRGGKKRSK